ncbi:DUF3467 domain-containing protein [Paenibacillus sp. FSL R5-0623]|uniref:DUF3467 domain-containing protein n=1 Tax=Paenibacillus sp. FSL R5-0623 TaxID=2921651 RepID=UPI0030D7B246
MIEATKTQMIKYIDTKSSDYKRTYANGASLTVNPQGDISIDFFEESIKPLMITERPLEVRNEEEVVFNHDKNVLQVEREKKVSVTMEREQAKELVRWLLDNIMEEEDLL